MKTDRATTPIIRDAHPEELDEVAAVLKDAFEQYARLIPPDAWQSYLEDIMDVRGRLPESQLIVAEVDWKIVGSVTLFLNESESPSPWPHGWAGVRLLGVRPAFRGKGVGKALMEECIRRCREKGVKMVGLHTTEAMGVARRMYERMGFVRVPEFDFHPSPEAVVVAYKLATS